MQSRDDEHVVLTCTDTGVGMTEEECAQATSRFYRGDGANQVANGSGLGLALVQRIIEEHGGTLDLDSSPEKGTRVTVHLPATSSPERVASPPNSSEHTDSISATS